MPGSLFVSPHIIRLFLLNLPVLLGFAWRLLKATTTLTKPCGTLLLSLHTAVPSTIANHHSLY